MGTAYPETAQQETVKLLLLSITLKITPWVLFSASPVPRWLHTDVFTGVWHDCCDLVAAKTLYRKHGRAGHVAVCSMLLTSLTSNSTAAAITVSRAISSKESTLSGEQNAA